MALWHRYVVFAVLPLAFLAGCSAAKSGPPAIGEAYVGPATLNLRQELAVRSRVAAVVKHGDRLDVLRTRRRFVEVRAAGGAVGWTDSRELLSTGQMRELRRLARSAATMPSQGAATVDEPLNIHTEASRNAPSFAQIPENGSVDVVGHRVAPRFGPANSEAIVIRRPPPPRRPQRPEKVSARLPAPPVSAPPPPPANWLDLSKSAPPAPGDDELSKAMFPPRDAAPEPAPVAKPVPMEDWSLVRTKDGRAGWVLSRMLIMAIPDEVAQYAEGHRITSYFALGDVPDGDALKHVWLWTTMAGHDEPYEFDSFRVFVWSLRHHRYETAYIDRDVRGYYPVEAHKGAGDMGAGATFSVILQDKEGQVVRRTYAFNGYRVSLTRTEPYQIHPEKTTSEIAAAAPGVAAPSVQKSVSWYARVRQRVRRLLSR
jgi:hypothetical protein